MIFKNINHIEIYFKIKSKNVIEWLNSMLKLKNKIQDLLIAVYNIKKLN